jgi:O-antigen/teichoic acid export membrane protein
LEFFNPFLSHILLARGDQKKSLYVATIKLVSFSLLAVWFIPRWGGVGAAWAQVLAAFLAFGFYFMFVLRGEKVLQTLFRLGQTLPAALVLGVFFLLLKDVQLLPLLAVGGVFYVLLLFLFRVLSMNDLKLLQGLR